MAKNSNEQDVYFQKAWSGDYSQFEKLDSDRRNKLAQDYMAEYCARIQHSPESFLMLTGLAS